MLLSMTGYGRSITTQGDLSYQVEIKSLNSKTTDIRCRLPDGFTQEEILIRQIVTDKVLRGRIDVIITDMSHMQEDGVTIPDHAIRSYYNAYKKIADELGADTSQLLPAIMRLADINSVSSVALSDDAWNVVKNALENAIIQLEGFRKSEGDVLANDLTHRVNLIKTLIPEIARFESYRIDKLKDRLKKNMDEFVQSNKIDLNRFEQEILFYIEKLDISEEKVRLEQHCSYFLEQMQGQSNQPGKVLGFIAQEMGREINTLGSKAQDSDMQQIVVTMKDELEKIKEQLANVL